MNTRDNGEDDVKTGDSDKMDNANMDYNGGMDEPTCMSTSFSPEQIALFTFRYENGYDLNETLSTLSMSAVCRLFNDTAPTAVSLRLEH